MKAAILAAGYADGVLRASAGRGGAWLAGAVRPFLGRISMDLVVIDITGCDEVGPGDMAELFGAHLLVDDAATAAGTNSYELLARVSSRIGRSYSGGLC